jgi:hypothetical protein
MDPIWNKIYHSLGAPDTPGISRLFDSEDVGAVGRERFIEILRVNDKISVRILCHMHPVSVL